MGCAGSIPPHAAHAQGPCCGPPSPGLATHVIAFANEPGLDGGYLLLGAAWSVSDKGDTVYRPVSLPDPIKLQRDWPMR